MKKTLILVSLALFLAVMVVTPVMAAGFDYAPFTAEVTGLVDDLVAPATAILGAVLAIAGAVLIVKVGFRWVRGFIR